MDGLPHEIMDSKSAAKVGRSGLSTARGIRAALLFGLLGFIAPIAAGLGFVLIRWLVTAANHFDLAYDLHSLPRYLAYPTVGTVLVFSAAGWASRAPGGHHRFVATLVIIVSICVPSWILETALIRSLEPPRFKGEIHYIELFDIDTCVILALPALASALALSMIRANWVAGTDEKLPRNPDFA